MTRDARFVVLLTMRAKPGLRPRLEHAVDDVREVVAANPDNLGQSVLHDLTDDDVLHVWSAWPDEATFREHEARQEHRAAIAGLAEFRDRVDMTTMSVTHRVRAREETS